MSDPKQRVGHLITAAQGGSGPAAKTAAAIALRTMQREKLVFHPHTHLLTTALRSFQQEKDVDKQRDCALAVVHAARGAKVLTEDEQKRAVADEVRAKRPEKGPVPSAIAAAREKLRKTGEGALALLRGNFAVDLDVSELKTELGLLDEDIQELFAAVRSEKESANAPRPHRHRAAPVRRRAAPKKRRRPSR